jgi:uncharacterized membrane protein
MATCTQCGGEVQDGLSFCPKCGQAMGGGQSTQSSQAMEQKADPQMAENVAGLLSYVLGWVTGIIFLIIDKRPFVRFHAGQSIVLFGGLQIISIIFSIVLGRGMMMGGGGAFGLVGMVYFLIEMAALVLWIVLMVKAYKGEKFRVPVAADIADSIFNK